MHSLLQDIGISIIVATIIGIVTYRIKQPIILGYLIAGALIGPEIGLKLITHPANIEIISEIGLIFLLFIIGLEMNIPKIITSGKQVIIAGLGQYLLCVLLGLGFFSLLGYGLSGKNITGLYLALLCALSSTAVVVKLLYDKFEMDTLAGRITVGVLIIQDIWAILILAFQPNLQNPHLSFFVVAILKTIALLGVGFLMSKYVLKHIYEWISKSPEMVVATSIGWCAFVAAAGGYIGLSKEMGALIAGLSISIFPYSLHITAKILPLRDFFLTLFFISLGMKILLPPFSLIFIVLGVVVFVIVSRFITVLPLLLLAGSGRRTGIITSLNLSQISEFSLVIAAIGVSYSHIGKDIMVIVIYAMSITCIISSYFIKYNHEIYLYLTRIISRFGIR
ncbi:MAG: cation:proton antiporter, partial [Planctomycetota bacterium]|nr:cation:proton antiporter [Planctomycetota bacterium]